MHFSGNFQADPSTRNNKPNNWKIGTEDIDNLWNHLGTREFWLYNTTVTSVTYLDGTTDNTKDKIIGLRMLNSDTHSSGMIVDFDAEIMQWKTEIWGQIISQNWVPLGTDNQHNSFLGILQPPVIVHDNMVSSL